MALAAASGVISKPLARIADAFNESSTFSTNFTNIHYNIIGRTLDATEVLSLSAVLLQRPFCLIVPDYPNGVRATSQSIGGLSYSGSAWVRLEMNQSAGTGDNYEELQRWWDNLVGDFLLELGQAYASNPSLLALNGWHSYASELSGEQKATKQGSFFRSVFKIDWGVGG